MTGDSDEGASRGWRHSLDFHIPQVAQLMHNVYNRAFRRLGVTRSQAVALTYLAEYGGLSQTELARLVGLGKAATGSLLHQMEEAGLILRQADPADGRSRMVSLGQSGTDLVDQFGVIGHELAVRIRAGITQAERRLVADVLGRMRVNLEAIETESSSIGESTSNGKDDLEVEQQTASSRASASSAVDELQGATRLGNGG